MWTIINYLGESVTWYSQDEMDWLMKKLDDAYKCRDDCELHWERERKTLKEKLNEAHDTNKSLGYTYLRYKEALEEIKKIVFQAEQKLHCCCDITEMLVNIETIINVVSKESEKENAR